MREAGIAEWYIESCHRIKYMFPKAHAVAYVMSAFRIAYFKVHYPIIYYASYFSTRVSDFDIETMIKGYNSIKLKIAEIIGKGNGVTNKETAVLDTLRIALEMTARGFTFENVSLEKSLAKTFVIGKDSKSLIPPYITIDGLGETVAEGIVNEREKRSFLSIEDMQKRAKVSGTLIDKMKVMGIFEGMSESNQLSLF
jgi:DNA polymerase-3 subunit alpha (Gram-positive type)